MEENKGKVEKLMEACNSMFVTPISLSHYFTRNCRDEEKTTSRALTA